MSDKTAIDAALAFARRRQALRVAWDQYWDSDEYHVDNVMFSYGDGSEPEQFDPWGTDAESFLDGLWEIGRALRDAQDPKVYQFSGSFTLDLEGETPVVSRTHDCFMPDPELEYEALATPQIHRLD